MSPEMRVRIAGQNDSSAAFSQVTRDAVAAGAAVRASGENAAIGLRTEAAAMETVRDLSRQTGARIQNLGFQLNDLGVQIASGGGILRPLIQQGSQVVGIYSGQGGVRAALSDVAGIATKLLPVGVAAGVVAAGFAGLTYEINKTAKTQVNFGDVFMATVQVAAESIGTYFKPAIDQLGTWFGQFIDWLVPAFKGTVNAIINGFVFAFDAIKLTWSYLPKVIGDVTIQTAQNVINALTDMLNKSRAQTMMFLSTTGTALGPIFGGAFSGAGLAVGGLPTFGAPKLDNPFAGYANEYGSQLGAAATGFENDPAGGIFAAISDKAQKLELASQAADKLGGALKGANDNAKLLAGGLKDVGGVTDLVAASQQNLADTAFGAVGQLTGGLSQLFKDNKAFAIANAVVNTAEGVTKALAQGGIFGFIGAAGVAAAGAAQIAAIASASPGSASAPSVGAGSSTATQPQQQASGTAINLTIRGSGSVNVDTLADQLAQSIADGGNQNLVKIIRAA